MEARSQLALCKLILQHTHNTQDACQHIVRAVRSAYPCINTLLKLYYDEQRGAVNRKGYPPSQL